MSFLFGARSKTPQEVLRENQRLLNRSIRDVDRERTTLETQEKQIVASIKKHAKIGQMSSVKILAKDLVRIRRHIDKFYEMRTHLQAVSMRLQTLKSTQAMAQAMGGVSRVSPIFEPRFSFLSHAFNPGGPVDEQGHKPSCTFKADPGF